MASIKPNTTIREYQNFVQQVYGVPNDQHWDTQEMLTNTQRFTMRGMKGIRKGNTAKITLNLLITLTWFGSLMNRLHIDLEQEIWNRFPYMCSYCAHCPCVCKGQKVKTRKKVVFNEKKRPKTLADFQDMFKAIYPPETRSIEHVGIHLAEEMGELSEAVLQYQSFRNKEDFMKITQEAADFFSCIMGVCNSMRVSVARELSHLFSKNCHICKRAPCECSFPFVANFKS